MPDTPSRAAGSSADAARVLITRPQAQAARLIDGVRRLGLQVVALPCLSIEALPARSDPPPHRGVAIFTSRNAVEHAQRNDGWPWPGVQALAIGPATAAALLDSGRAPLRLPREPFDTEALLEQLDERTGAAVALAEGITIVTGEGGRTRLDEALRESGHTVRRRELYRRRPARPTPAQIDRALSPLPDLVCASSDAVLDALLHIVADGPHGAHRIERLQRVPVLVNGERCAAHARRTGFRGPVLVASPAGDAGQLAALARWQHAQPGRRG